MGGANTGAAVGAGTENTGGWANTAVPRGTDWRGPVARAASAPTDTIATTKMASTASRAHLPHITSSPYVSVESATVPFGAGGSAAGEHRPVHEPTDGAHQLRLGVQVS